MDDRQIIDRCLTGDREAFDVIVNRYQSGVLSLAWSVLGCREEAEDAAQEAFFRAYENLSDFGPPLNLKNWIFAIAFHRCLDRLRSRKTESKARERWAWEDRGGGGDSGPERSLEALAVLGPHWKRLSAKERTALALAVVEGYSAAEIAEVLHCAESTARVHVFKAKRKLRRWMKVNVDVPTP
jgi:RNA polymerase sigma-70 factor (ECF subfamily)